MIFIFSYYKYFTDNIHLRSSGYFLQQRFSYSLSLVRTFVTQMAKPYWRQTSLDME